MGTCSSCTTCVYHRTTKQVSSSARTACSTITTTSDTYSKFDTIGKGSYESEQIDDVDSDFGSELDFPQDDDTVVDPDEIIRALTPVDRPYQTSRLGRHSADTPATIEEETEYEDESESEDEHEMIKWKKGNRIGKGSFGTVWCGLTTAGELIAVKEIEVEPDFPGADKEYNEICEEVNVLRTLEHRNIVKANLSFLPTKIVDSLEHTLNYLKSLLLSWSCICCLGSVISRFGALEEPVISRYTRQILGALVYLHANNVIHRDIKSGNILLMPDGTVKLIDFGCAKRLCTKLGQHGSNLQKSLRGTPYWMAPEVVNESGHGKRSDIWSLGCTVFEMCTGKPPWGDREPLAAMFAVGAELPVPDLPTTFSVECREFVSSCLTRDKLKRPSATELRKYPFVAKKGSKNIGYTTGKVVAVKYTSRTSSTSIF